MTNQLQEYTINALKNAVEKNPLAQIWPIPVPPKFIPIKQIPLNNTGFKVKLRITQENVQFLDICIDSACNLKSIKTQLLGHVRVLQNRHVIEEQLLSLFASDRPTDHWSVVLESPIDFIDLSARQQCLEKTGFKFLESLKQSNDSFCIPIGLNLQEHNPNEYGERILKKLFYPKQNMLYCQNKISITTILLKAIAAEPKAMHWRICAPVHSTIDPLLHTGFSVVRMPDGQKDMASLDVILDNSSNGFSGLPTSNHIRWLRGRPTITSQLFERFKETPYAETWSIILDKPAITPSISDITYCLDGTAFQVINTSEQDASTVVQIGLTNVDSDDAYGFELARKLNDERCRVGVKLFDEVHKLLSEPSSENTWIYHLSPCHADILVNRICFAIKKMHNIDSLIFETTKREPTSNRKIITDRNITFFKDRQRLTPMPIKALQDKIKQIILKIDQCQFPDNHRANIKLVLNHTYDLLNNAIYQKWLRENMNDRINYCNYFIDFLQNPERHKQPCEQMYLMMKTLAEDKNTVVPHLESNYKLWVRKNSEQTLSLSLQN